MPSDQSEWEWRSPRRSASVIRDGSVPARAASISPWSSRSSGGMNGRSEERVDLLLGREGPELGGRAGDRLAVLADSQEPLLGQAPATVAGPLAETNVVGLRAREVDEVGPGGARHHPHQVDLRPAGDVDRGLLEALVEHRCDRGEGGEPADDGAGIARSRRAGRGRRSSPDAVGSSRPARPGGPPRRRAGPIERAPRRRGPGRAGDVAPSRQGR